MHVIGLGHDMQAVSEVESCSGLLEPDAMFTGNELAMIGRNAEPARCMASLFSCKEAFFKAIPVQQGWHWCELELGHDERGRPHFTYSGQLKKLMHAKHWTACVSVSHSGHYVSSCVLIQQAQHTQSANSSALTDQ